jgi:hypothetical protein
VGRELRGRDDGDNITNVGIITMKPPLYHEYIVIKIHLKRNFRVRSRVSAPKKKTKKKQKNKKIKRNFRR